MSPLLNKAAVRHLSGRQWITFEELVYASEKHGVITVPEKFRTDLDSVPRLPFAYWLTKNSSVEGAIIHDYLYAKGETSKGKITRKEADEVFLLIMEEEGVSWWRRRLIYRGVRLGGWLPWNRYRAKEKLPKLTRVK